MTVGHVHHFLYSRCGACVEKGVVGMTALLHTLPGTHDFWWSSAHCHSSLCLVSIVHKLPGHVSPYRLINLHGSF